MIAIAAVPVVLTQELPGRVSAFFDAPVQARVSGVVEKRLFREGADVKAGQVLYQIEPEPYEAALRTAQGTLANAQANVIATRATMDRYSRLVASGAVDRQDYDNAVASYHAYQGDVVSDEGTVQTARINLGFTRVVSPVSGRIGISQVTEGAYVQEGTATLLATVQQLDPVYVDVVETSSALIKMKRDLADGTLKSDGAGHVRVKLIEENGREYPQEGLLQLSDVTVSTSTNTVTVRSIFPNPNEDLLPGMFVRASFDEGSVPEGILIPQMSAAHNVKGEFTALVVGEGSKVELRILEVSRSVRNQWLIAKGLKPGDQLIVDNLQKLKPGTIVKPVPAKLPVDYLPPPGGKTE